MSCILPPFTCLQAVVDFLSLYFSLSFQAWKLFGISVSSPPSWNPLTIPVQMISWLPSLYNLFLMPTLSFRSFQFPCTCSSFLFHMCQKRHLQCFFNYEMLMITLSPFSVRKSLFGTFFIQGGLFDIFFTFMFVCVSLKYHALNFFLSTICFKCKTGNISPSCLCLVNCITHSSVPFKCYGISFRNFPSYITVHYHLHTNTIDATNTVKYCIAQNRKSFM